MSGKPEALQGDSSKSVNVVIRTIGLAEPRLSRLCISTQCGFASAWERNPLTEEVWIHLQLRELEVRNGWHIREEDTGKHKEGQSSCKNTEIKCILLTALYASIQVPP